MKVKLQPLGDTAIVADGATAPALLDRDRPPGVADVVAAFGKVAVYFDPGRTASGEVAEWVTRRLSSGKADDATTGKPVELPVCYGGVHGPDLGAVAAQAGKTADEVIQRHQSPEYSVGAIGFQPGFAYLEGLPTELHTPRIASPRTRVPAGSVGIGGAYTGVYPNASPGGWNLLGRTPLTLFDPRRDPPSLIGAGDRIKFRAIDEREFERLAAENAPQEATEETPPGEPLFRVVSPGVQTTRQGLGRTGWRHLGVTPGGAMDPWSLRLANRLVGNEEGATALEATLVGPVLECLRDVTVGLAGAVDGARQKPFAAGERIDLRKLVRGARAYVAVPGGFARPGGLVGSSAMAAGDLLWQADDAASLAIESPSDHDWSVAALTIPEGATTELRVVRGPQADAFGADAWRRFFDESFRVSAQSNRMGVRCEGPVIERRGDESTPSQPVGRGVVQVPPDGQPIVLGADGQTLGGYPVIACVASVDWPRLGQLRPGDSVRFIEIDPPEAETLLRQSEQTFAHTAAGIATKGG